MPDAPNLLYYGDNLDVLRRHVPSESVDLVYLDPPFHSNADDSAYVAEQDIRTFKTAAKVKKAGGDDGAVVRGGLVVGHGWVDGRARLPPSRVGVAADVETARREPRPPEDHVATAS